MLLMDCCGLCVGAGGLVVPCPMLPLVHNFPVRTQKDVRVRSKYKRAAPKPPNVQRCQSWPPPKAAAFRRWRGAGRKATARLQELPVFLAGCIAPHKQTPQGSQNPALPESIPGSVLSFSLSWHCKVSRRLGWCDCSGAEGAADGGLQRGRAQCGRAGD